MKRLQGFHHAFYELLYAIGHGEGQSLVNFKKSLRALLKKEFEGQAYVIDFVLEGNRMDVKIACLWAIKELKKNREHFNAEEKIRIRRVVDAFTVQNPQAAFVLTDIRQELDSF